MSVSNATPPLARDRDSLTLRPKIHLVKSLHPHAVQLLESLPASMVPHVVAQMLQLGCQTFLLERLAGSALVARPATGLAEVATAPNPANTDTARDSSPPKPEETVNPIAKLVRSNLAAEAFVLPRRNE